MGRTLKPTDAYVRHFIVDPTFVRSFSRDRRKGKLGLKLNFK
jgi:hypothetical protein